MPYPKKEPKITKAPVVTGEFPVIPTDSQQAIQLEEVIRNPSATFKDLEDAYDFVKLLKAYNDEFGKTIKPKKLLGTLALSLSDTDKARVSQDMEDFISELGLWLDASDLQTTEEMDPTLPMDEVSKLVSEPQISLIGLLKKGAERLSGDDRRADDGALRLGLATSDLIFLEDSTGKVGNGTIKLVDSYIEEKVDSNPELTDLLRFYKTQIRLVGNMKGLLSSENSRVKKEKGSNVISCLSETIMFLTSKGHSLPDIRQAITLYLENNLAASYGQEVFNEEVDSCFKGAINEVNSHNLTEFITDDNWSVKYGNTEEDLTGGDTILRASPTNRTSLNTVYIDWKANIRNALDEGDGILLEKSIPIQHQYVDKFKRPVRVNLVLRLRTSFRTNNTKPGLDKYKMTVNLNDQGGEDLSGLMIIDWRAVLKDTKNRQNVSYIFKKILEFAKQKTAPKSTVYA